MPMGIFANAKAVKDVERLRRSGGTAMLSKSQIVNMIINLPDANRNLSKEEFNNVYALFTQISRDKVKTEMTFDDYLQVAADLAEEFDRIAPFTQYCGDPSFY